MRIPLSRRIRDGMWGKGRIALFALDHADGKKAQIAAGAAAVNAAPRVAVTENLTGALRSIRSPVQ